MGHHHHARQIMDAALVSRGMAPLPAPWVCPCCHGEFGPDEQASAEDFGVSAELIDRYGDMPCLTCADDHALCAHCGKATRPADPSFCWGDPDAWATEAFCCEDCRKDWWENE